jgi:glycosyltransferase involved in cell wall biosynthesis
VNLHQDVDGKLFSVVVPVLNEEKYVESLVRGIHRQSYRPIEIIVVDGGSRDRTVEILNCLKRELQSRDFTITVMRESAGVGRQRGLGLATSSGQYVVFLDADMFLNDEEFLARIGEALDKNPVAAYVCEVKGETWWERNLAADFELATKKWNERTPPNAFQREILKGINWDNSLAVGEDVDFINQVRTTLKIERVEPVARVHCHLPHSFKEYSVRCFWYGQTLIPFVKKYGQSRATYGWVLRVVPFLLLFLIPLTYLFNPVSAFALLGLLVSGMVYRFAGSPEKNVNRILYVAISTIIGSLWFSLGLGKGILEYAMHRRVPLGRPNLW